MQRTAAWFAVALCAAVLFTAVAGAAQSEHVVFLSTQLRPISEAQKMRNFILKDFPGEVDYLTERAGLDPVRISKEGRAGGRGVDVVGALHGELQSIVDALEPLDGVAATLAGRGIPEALLRLGKLGTAHQLYIPWMQASYIMVANKKALPYLPDGADIDTLSYDQLTTWARTIKHKTGKRLLGFPAGPQGLMHRFLEGFLYPSFTGGVVVPFRSEAAEAMWVQFAELWHGVNPNSTSFDFMQQPLLSGEVWIAFDHVARVLSALREKPEDFVVFPAPAGPRGRGYMPVLAGLAMLKKAPHKEGAAALIDYLSQAQTQIAITRAVGFVPVVKAELPEDLEPGLKMAATALGKMQSAQDALPALPPTGLGHRADEFDRVLMDTFQFIILRGQNPRMVLDREADVLTRLMTETGASCWQPDLPSAGACQVQ